RHVLHVRRPQMGDLRDNESENDQSCPESHTRNLTRHSSSKSQMFAETFLQDLRIGLRVLIKEKAFCALAVTVLALGICGVTALFAVVNGALLRGFSFPNSARLASVNFID